MDQFQVLSRKRWRDGRGGGRVAPALLVAAARLLFVLPLQLDDVLRLPEVVLVLLTALALAVSLLLLLECDVLVLPLSSSVRF